MGVSEKGALGGDWISEISCGHEGEGQRAIRPGRCPAERGRLWNSFASGLDLAGQGPAMSDKAPRAFITGPNLRGSMGRWGRSSAFSTYSLRTFSSFSSLAKDRTWSA